MTNLKSARARLARACSPKKKSMCCRST